MKINTAPIRNNADETVSSAGRCGTECTQSSPSSTLNILRAFHEFERKISTADAGRGCSTLLSRVKARKPKTWGSSYQKRRSGRKTNSEVSPTIASQTIHSLRAPLDCECNQYKMKAAMTTKGTMRNGLYPCKPIPRKRPESRKSFRFRVRRPRIRKKSVGARKSG